MLIYYDGSVRMNLPGLIVSCCCLLFSWEGHCSACALVCLLLRRMIVPGRCCVSLCPRVQVLA